VMGLRSVLAAWYSSTAVEPRCRRSIPGQPGGEGGEEEGSSCLGGAACFFRWLPFWIFFFTGFALAPPGLQSLHR
jgi:hypothetical protein